MSYAFSKCLEAQTAFECAEEIFIVFLETLISTIIRPFKSSFNKFNISKTEISQLNLLFDAISNLYEFHSSSRDQLSSESNIPNLSNPNSSNKKDSKTKPNLTVSSPPPNKHHRHHHHKSSHGSFGSFGGSFGLNQQNLNDKIFKYYGLFPTVYRNYFDAAIQSLQYLSNIITPRQSIRKWFKSKCDDITYLSDPSNAKPYQSFAEILRDILIHCLEQSDKLDEIAKSKYLKNSNEAKIFKENMRIHLENVFIRKWENQYRPKFEMVHLEMTLNQTNIQLFDDHRRLMITFDVDLPTKARSTKNLFGLAKNNNATREGLLYIFNDMVLITTKQGKFKGCYDFNDDHMEFMQSTDEKSIIFGRNTKCDKKKVTVFMEPEQCRMAFDAIREYQTHIKRSQAAQKQQKWSVASSDDYIVNTDDVDFTDITDNSNMTPRYGPILSSNSSKNNNMTLPGPISINSSNHSIMYNKKSPPIPISNNPKFTHYLQKTPSPNNPIPSYSTNNSNHTPSSVYSQPLSKPYNQQENVVNDIQKSSSFPSQFYMTPSAQKKTITPSPSMNLLQSNTKYNRGHIPTNKSHSHSMSNNRSIANYSFDQQRASMKSASVLTDNTAFNDISEPRTSTAYSSIHPSSATPETSVAKRSSYVINKRLSQYSNGGYPDISYSPNGQKNSLLMEYGNITTPISESSYNSRQRSATDDNKTYIPFTTPQRTATGSTISSISSQQQQISANKRNTITSLVIMENQEQSGNHNMSDISPLKSSISRGNRDKTHKYEYSNDTLNSNDLLESDGISINQQQLDFSNLDSDDSAEDEELNDEQREKFKLYRTNSLQHGRRFSVPSMLSSIASSGKKSENEGSTDDDKAGDNGISKSLKNNMLDNGPSNNMLDVSDSGDLSGSERGCKSKNIKKTMHGRQRSKSFGVRLNLNNAKQVRFKNYNSINSIFDETDDIIKEPDTSHDFIPNENEILEINTHKKSLHHAHISNDSYYRNERDEEEQEEVITDLVLNIAENKDHDDNNNKELNALYAIRREIDINGDLLDNNDGGNDNDNDDMMDFDMNDIPIYDEDEMIAKDDIENASEEECIMEEHKERKDELAEMAAIDINEEDTPSVTDNPDPHNLLNIEFIEEDYTSDDDHDFKMKLLFQPKWAKTGKNEVGEVRDYQILSTKEYYMAHREVLNDISYSQNMHIHKLQIAEQLKQKEKELMQDTSIKKRDKLKIIKQMNDETENQKQQQLKVQRHPFERFLDEMHEYEQNGGSSINDEDRLSPLTASPSPLPPINKSMDINISISPSASPLPEINKSIDIDQLTPTSKSKALRGKRKKTPKHKRIQSQEIYYFDDNDEVLVDEQGQYLEILYDHDGDNMDSTKPGLRPRISNSSNSNNRLPLLLNVGSTGNLSYKSRLNSISTLGPSPSVLEEMAANDDKDELKKERTIDNEDDIDYKLTKPTKETLNQFNLQTANSLLLSEVQRLRLLLNRNESEMNEMENEIQGLKVTLNDKEIQTKTLRSTIIALKKQNDEQNDELNDKMKTMETLQDENNRYRIDNDRLNRIVHDYPLQLMDDDSISQRSSSIPAALPSMNWSKSDQTDINNINIAPGLLMDHNKKRSSDKEKEKKIKFDKLTQMRNSGKTAGSNTTSPSSRNTTTNTTKKKNKTFRRPKYHSFVLGQAKKEHQQKLRDRHNKNNNNNLDNNNNTESVDHLNSVKNQLINLKLQGLMPQSRTQCTPLGTPKNQTNKSDENSTIGSMSIIEPNLSIEEEIDPPLTLSFGPVSAPTYNLNDNYSPSPQCSPLPDSREIDDRLITFDCYNNGNSNNNNYNIDRIISIPKPVKLIDIKGKSVDTVQDMKVNINHHDISPNNHHNNKDYIDRHRKDTPTPNNNNKTKKKQWYNKANNNNMSVPIENKLNNMLLKTKNSPLSRTTPHLRQLPQLNAIPSQTATSSANSTKNNLQNNNNLRRISFAQHHNTMRYVGDDDDESDISRSSFISNKTSKTSKTSSLQRRRITYTKSANTVFASNTKASGSNNSLYNISDQSSTTSPLPKDATPTISPSPSTQKNNIYKNINKKPRKSFTRNMTRNNNQNNNEQEIPSYFGRKSQSKSFSVKPIRKHRSGSISSYSTNRNGLKDRTKGNKKNISYSLPKKKSIHTPCIHPSVTNNNNDSKQYKRKSLSQKRRSVNFTPSRTQNALKSRTKPSKFISKSPNFIPKCTPSTYPNTFDLDK